MKKICFVMALLVLFLTGCDPKEADLEPTPSPAQTATETPTPTPEPSPTEEPVDYNAAYQEALSLAQMGEFYHRPFEELPEELRSSLVWDGEIRGIEGESLRLRTYTAPGIVVTTTEAPEELLRGQLDWWLSLPQDDEGRQGRTDEEARAEYQLELGREWLYQVTITDGSYATTRGLKVGNTVEEAEALGYHFNPEYYPAGQDWSAHFGPPLETNLEVSVEDGVVTQLSLSFGLGRFVGKYYDLTSY